MNVEYIFDDVIIWNMVVDIGILVVYIIGLVVVFEVKFFKNILLC